MYARYIPPAKSNNHQTLTPTTQTQPQPRPEPQAQPRPQAEPQPSGSDSLKTVQGNGFSYSRYVPGGASANLPTKERTIQFFDDDSSLNAQPKRKWPTGDEGDTDASPKKKKIITKPKVPKTVETSPDAINGDKVQRKSKVKREKELAAKEVSGSQPCENHKTDETTSDALPTSTILPTHQKKDIKEKREKKEKKEKKRREKQLGGSTSQDGAATSNNVTETVSAPIKQNIVHPDRQQGLVGKEQNSGEPRHQDDQKEAGSEEDDSDNEKTLRHKSVLQRRANSLKFVNKNGITPEKDGPEDEEPDVELHGLDPLPQPQRRSKDFSKPAYETLPSWLAAPIRVDQKTTKSFPDLGILPKAARVLEEQGYKEALAVQTAVIPLLLPSSMHRNGDVLISAATGSGKTLAYALPMVEDISKGLVTRLRALVVLPTRELVKQAQDVLELCAKSYEGGERKRVRIGTSVGSQSLKFEQDALMASESRYDPQTYNDIIAQYPSKATQSLLAELEMKRKEPRLGKWPGEIFDFTSKVDILICTPGRLVEHLEQTPGFSLDYVRWLVVDEADKLLAQSFQGWLEVVLEQLKTSRFSARDFLDVGFSGVRKVILSATLTRDLSLLSQLGLRRPQMVVLDNEAETEVAEHTLPLGLREYAIRVHDPDLKPLYLLALLSGQHMKSTGNEDKPIDMTQPPQVAADYSSDTTDTTDTSTSGSDTDSSSGDDGQIVKNTTQRGSKLPIALIFTKSNESALRLSRLLVLLDKTLQPHITSLTSNTPARERRKTLQAFTTPNSLIRLIIASDLVARGIDLPKLDHVINYDLPPSLAGYVHRVGRTSRAGRSGSAWTLVGDSESGWFWGKIAKGSGIRRAQKVERTRIEEMGEERMKEYEYALQRLGKEAADLRRR